MEGAGTKESTDKSAEWNSANSKLLATEEEAETAGEAGGVSETRTITTWGTQESGTRELPGVIADGKNENSKATSAATYKAGAGGRHEARPWGKGEGFRTAGKPSW